MNGLYSTMIDKQFSMVSLTNNLTDEVTRLSQRPPIAEQSGFVSH